MDRVIGIDLGGANSSVAAFKGGQPVPLADEQGRVLTPSIVAYLAEGEPLVGAEARRRRLIDPTRTIQALKRLLGRDAADPAVRQLASRLSYPVVAGPSGKACVAVGEQVYTPSEVGAVLLSNLKQRAEAQLGDGVRKTVLVVPACFNDPQRLALRLCAQVAGLEVVRLLNAPTAAALLYAHGRGLRQRVGVYSFGAAGFDFSIIDLHDRVVRVVASGGDSLLGGDDFDRGLFDQLRRRFLDDHRVDLGDDPVATQRLLGAAESAKVHLTDNPSVEVRLREMAYADSGPIDLSYEVSRKDLNGPGQDIVRRTFAVCESVLAAARCDVGDLDVILATGGSTRIPLVLESVTRFFRKTPLTDVQHDGAAAMGAALYGSSLFRGGGAREPIPSLVVDVQSAPVYLDVQGRAPEKLLPRNAVLPASTRRTLTTTDDDQRNVTVRLLQGDGGATRVGDLVVDGLRPEAKGSVKVDVTFEVDCDGVLTIAAQDAHSGQRTPQPVRVGVEALEQDVVLLRMQRGEIRA